MGAGGMGPRKTTIAGCSPFFYELHTNFKSYPMPDIIGQNHQHLGIYMYAVYVD